MKKLFILFIATLLLSACGSDEDDSMEPVTITGKSTLYYRQLQEGNDGYMYAELSTIYYSADVISYELSDIEGDHRILSYSKGSTYSYVHEASFLKVKYVLDLTVERWNEIKGETDSADAAVSYTSTFTLKAGYRTE